jgi:hypothetical protein
MQRLCLTQRCQGDTWHRHILRISSSQPASWLLSFLPFLVPAGIGCTGTLCAIGVCPHNTHLSCPPVTWLPWLFCVLHAGHRPQGHLLRHRHPAAALCVRGEPQAVCLGCSSVIFMQGIGRTAPSCAIDILLQRLVTPHCSLTTYASVAQIAAVLAFRASGARAPSAP